MYKVILFIILIFTTRKGATQYLDCGVIDRPCYIEELYPSGFPIEIEKKWESEVSINPNQTVLVYNDKNCMPALVAMTSNGEYTKDNKLLEIDPLNGQISKSTNIFGYHYSSANCIAISDVDNDGDMEYFIIFSNSVFNPDSIKLKLVCYSKDGTIRWISNEGYTENVITNVALADFNMDGIPEVYTSNKIFNSLTGVLLADGNVNGYGSRNFDNALAIAANFDTTDLNLELAAGYTIYNVEINNTNGISGNIMTPNNITIDGQLLDGYTSSGDINADGVLDVIVTRRMNNSSTLAYAYSINGSNTTLLASKLLPTGYAGPALIKNDKSDILPTLIFPGIEGLFGLQYNGTNVFDLLWEFSYGQNAGSTCIAYDLNNDGYSELVFRDRAELYILQIINNIPTLVLSVPCITELLRVEAPMIADIDNSGQAKICITCGTYEDAKLVAFGSPDTLPGWTPARSIWNQHNYNVLNINDDGTVPQYMESNATYENGRYNNFYQQATVLDSNGMHRHAAASLFGEVQCVNYDAESGQYTVTFDVSNRADASLSAALDLPISFYEGNPEIGGILIGTYKTTSIITVGYTLKDLTFTFTAPSLTQLFMVVNTERATSGIFDAEKDYQTLECDYTDNISQTIDIPQVENIQASICEGDSYDFFGESIITAGNHYKNILNVEGCDSLIGVLELSIVDTIQIQTKNTTCDTYTWNGDTYTQSGVYQYSTQNMLGCDSIVTLDLTIHNSNDLTENSTACDSFIWNGALLTESGSYPFSGQNIFGCDSMATLNLTIRPSHDIVTMAQACESYTWNDSIYELSGLYTFETKNQYGCDSMITLDLIINDVLNSSESITTCDSLVWNGQTYTQDGTFMFESTSMQGCDSIAKLDLTLYKSAKITSPQTVCDSIIWNGDIYTQSGQYLYKTQTAKGCDSIVTLDLTILKRSNAMEKINTCESYIWNGQTYTESGLYTHDTINQFSCDSIITLDLTIHDVSEEIVPRIACDTFEWNGTVYSQSGNYPYETINSFGCDSTAVLDLKINFSATMNLQESACDSLIFEGKILRESGDYTFDLMTAAGCDSIVTLSLFLFTTSEISTVESCDSFMWDETNEAYLFSGQYVKTYANTLGCDSIQILDLIIHDSYQFVSVDEACDTYTWPVNDEVITVSGQYKYPLTTTDGCDSVYTLDITINPDYTIVDTVSTTFEYTWKVNGIIYTTSGVYTEQFTTNSQCDSIHLLLLTIDNQAEIFTPNIIKPGGANTYFTIFGNSAIALIQDLSIYDRWGNKVFNAKSILPNDPLSGWNGTFNGQNVVPGVYIWQAKLLLSDGKIEEQIGDLTVIR